MKTEIVVRGTPRTVHLGKQLSPNKWLAKVYVNSDDVASGRTSVAGIYQIYANGARRFTPTGIRKNFL